MKKDIKVPKVKGIYIALVPESKDQIDDLWKVYIVNTNNYGIENVIINSTGYGDKDGRKQQTSTMRRFIEKLPGNSYGTFESIDPSVFHLTNEYFVTYYKDGLIHDKNYIFVPDSIVEENLTQVPLVAKEGVLHE